MHHEAKDAHLGSTAVVELDGHLLLDCGIVPLGGLELGSLDLILAGGVPNLNQADEGNDLCNATNRHGLQSSKTVLYTRKGYTVGNIARQTHARGSYDVAEHSEHGNTAMLRFDGAEAIEALLIGLLEQAKGIPEAERGLNANLCGG